MTGCSPAHEMGKMKTHLLRCAVDMVTQSWPCLSQSNDCGASQIATGFLGIL